jgi:AcrR family transcriptional regulator
MDAVDETLVSAAWEASSVTPPFGRLRPGPGRAPGEVASHQRARINRALIEVAVERGYGSATVREVARVAGISTRAFYEHYAGKEDCFLQVHQLMARRLLSSVRASEAGAGNREARLAAAVGAVIDEWGRSREASWFFLFCPPGGGSAALKQMRLAECSLGVMLGRHLVDGPGGKKVQRQIASGIVAGLASVSRGLMLDGHDIQQPGLRDELTRWALSYQPRSMDEIEALERCAERELAVSPPVPSSEAEKRDRAGSARGDLALLHSAVAKLAGSSDRGALTLKHVCAAAGVPRRSFEANFADLDDCLAVAGDLRASSAIECVLRCGEAGSTVAGKVCRSVTALSVLAARDPVFGNLCFGDVSQNGEWLARREQRLVDGFSRLLYVKDLVSHPLDQTAIHASLGATLGLIGGEVARGRQGSVDRKSSVFSYLMLAPVIGASSAISAIREENILAKQA